MIDEELAFRREQLEKAQSTTIVPIEEFDLETIPPIEKFAQITTFLEDFGNANLESYILCWNAPPAYCRGV